MAEFVPDGHKYGIRYKVPWGAHYTTYSCGIQYFSNVQFVVSMGGGGLGL